MRNNAQWVGSRWAVLAALPLLAVCCQPPYKTPPPPFVTRGVDSVAWDSIEAYAQTLRFDTELYAADSERVAFDTLGRETRFSDSGDPAKIEPERGAWALDTNQLAEGRIIAQITTTKFHQAFGYGPHPTWWWVDKRGGKWRSLYLSDSLRKRIPASLHLETHRGYHWGQSLARWQSLYQTQWGTCCYNCCCTGGPPAPK